MKKYNIPTLLSRGEYGNSSLHPRGSISILAPQADTFGVSIEILPSGEGKVQASPFLPQIGKGRNNILLTTVKNLIFWNEKLDFLERKT